MMLGGRYEVPSTINLELQAWSLDLLGTPASIGVTTQILVRPLILGKRSDIPHVRRRLNGGDELESSVSDTDDTDKGTWDNAEPLLADNDGADKNVDYVR
jgi:hypothetical protein